MSRYNRGSASGSSKAKTTTEQNQRVLKTLLNDPSNKHCADCKTTGHPRWASWSLGIFLCIRCSGIHRSLGTHISKVRSIDLDSWDDMHLENMIKWGNKRANLYWEHGLPGEYVPDEGKIQNFIRTKYEWKKWVKPGGVPDPATLEDSAGREAQEDATPLAQVKQNLDTKKPNPTPSSNGLIPDLLGDDAAAVAPAAKSQPTVTTQFSSISSNSATKQTNESVKPQSSPSASAPPPPPPKQPADSLLGLDFDAKPSPASTTSSAMSSRQSSQSSGVSRPDLKKSILSLYANSRPSQAQPQAQQQPQPQQQPVQQPSAFDALTSGTANLSLNASPPPQQPSMSFFDSMPTQPSRQPPHQQQSPQPKQADAFASLSFGSGSSKPAQSATSELKMSNTQRASVTGGYEHQPSVFDSLASPKSSFSAPTPPQPQPTTQWDPMASSSKPHNDDDGDDEWASFASVPSSKKSPINTSNTIPGLDDNPWA